MTRDNVSVTVDAVVYFRVVDPVAAVIRVENFLKAQIRDGRFTVRAFFDTPTGIAVEQTPVLIPGNDTWISLQGCSSTSGVKTMTFSLSASLADPVSSWPTMVYTMYTSYGVEMVTETRLGLEPASVRVLASPWEVPLNDSLI